MQQYYTDDNREERLRHDHLLFALDIAGIGTWDLDLVKNEVTLDAQCSLLIGVAPGEPLTYEQALRYIHPADAPYVHEAVQQALDPSAQGLFDLRYRILRADGGDLRRVFSRGKVYFDEGGSASRIAGITQDITEEVDPGEKNTPVEYLAEAALNNTRVGLFWISLTKNAIEYSPAFAAILTGEPNTYLSREDFIAHIHPEDVGIREAAYKLAAQSGDLFFECRTIWNDGTVHWIRTVGSYTADRGMFSGTVQNITPERQLQQDVASAQRLAELAIKCSGMGVFHFDLIHDLSEYSPAFAAILTGNAGRQGLSHRDFSEYVYPEDRPLGAAMIESAFRTGEINYEPRVVWEDGSVRRIHINGTCTFDEAGRPKALSGTVRDITLHDLQENAILAVEAKYSRAKRKSEAMFRNITNSAPTGLWLSDEHGTLSYINKTLVEWTGMSYESMLNEGWAAAVVAEDRQHSESAFLSAVADRDHYDAMFRMRKGDGSVVWCRAGGDPYYDDDGRFAGYAGYCMDIDELVKATAELSAGELRFRSIVEQAPMAIGLLMGREMIIEVGNEQLFEVWGKDKSITGRRLTDALPEIIDQGFLELLEGVYDTGQPFFGNGVLARLLRKGRLEEAYFDFAYTPLRQADGRVSGVMVLATEVTQQVMSRKALEDSEARFRSLIEEAPIATSIYRGRELIIETANEAMMNVWGKGPNVIGKPLQLALPELEGQPFLKILDQVFTTGVAYHSQEDIVNLLKDGVLQSYYFNFTYKPLKDGNGAVYAILNMAVDVTEQRQSQLALEHLVQQRTEELAAINEALTRSNAQLVRSNEELAQYAYVASHDLQEPLRKIQMFSGMLGSRQNLSPGEILLVGKITQSSERMSMLIKDLLDFSRLLKSEMLVRPVDLKEVSDAVVNDFELTIEEKEASVRIGPMPVIQAISLQMNQLFYNLLGNALKFSKPGTHPVIEIRAVGISQEAAAQHIPEPLPFAQYYHISIRDNGIGFEVKYAEQIFEVFKRLHGRELYPGSGIGLALCRRIIENHRGCLYAESTQGEGATFHLILPDRQQDHASLHPSQSNWVKN